MRCCRIARAPDPPCLGTDSHRHTTAWQASWGSLESYKYGLAKLGLRLGLIIGDNKLFDEHPHDRRLGAVQAGYQRIRFRADAQGQRQHADGGAPREEIANIR